jgi:hypothetical protein
VTIQRQVSQKMSLEVGYVGRLIRNEMLSRNLDTVPYMTTLGGQTFADAYAKTYFPVAATSGALTNGFVTTAQPFFESALGGPNGAYCQGYANCTSAVAAKNAADIRNTSVSNLWTSLSKAPGGRWDEVCSALPSPAVGWAGYTYLATDATGFGNYNALFVTYRLRDFHGFWNQPSPGAARSVPAPPRRPPVPIQPSMSSICRTTTGRRASTSNSYTTWASSTRRSGMQARRAFSATSSAAGTSRRC